MSDELTLDDQLTVSAGVLFPGIRTIWEVSLRLLRQSRHGFGPPSLFFYGLFNHRGGLQELDGLRESLRSIMAVAREVVSLDCLISNREGVMLWGRKFSTAHKAVLSAAGRIVKAADGHVTAMPSKPIYAEQLRRIAAACGPLLELDNLGADLEFEVMWWLRRATQRFDEMHRQEAFESTGARSSSGDAVPKRLSKHPRSALKKEAVKQFNSLRSNHSSKNAARMVNQMLGTSYSTDTLSRYARGGKKRIK